MVKDIDVGLGLAECREPVARIDTGVASDRRLIVLIVLRRDTSVGLLSELVPRLVGQLSSDWCTIGT